MFTTSEFNPVVISTNDMGFYLQNDPTKGNNIMIPVYPIMNHQSNVNKQIERERVVKIIKAKLHRYLDMFKEITLLLSVNNDYTLFKFTSGTYVTFKLSSTKHKSGIITSYDILINNDVSNTTVYSLSACTRNGDNNGMVYNIVQCMWNIQKMERFADRKENFYQLAMEYQIKKMEINLHTLKHRDIIIKSFNKYNQFDFMFKEGYIDKQLTPLLNVLFLEIPITEQRTSMIIVDISTTTATNSNDAYQSKISYMTYHIPSLQLHCTVDEFNVPLYQHTINYGNLCFNQEDTNVNYKPIKCECILNELSHGTVVFSFRTFEPIGIVCYSDTTTNNKYMLPFEHPALLLMLYMFVEDDDDGNENADDDIININEFIRSRKVIKEKHVDVIESNDSSKSNYKQKNLFVIHKQNRNVNPPLSSYNQNNNNKVIKTHPLKTFTTYKVIHTHNNNTTVNTQSNTLLTTPPKTKYIQKLLPITTTTPQTYTNIKRYRPNFLETKTLCLNSNTQS
jgi:hypothetical protein